MEYRELNQYIEVYMADVDVCASKLQEWIKHVSAGSEENLSAGAD